MTVLLVTYDLNKPGQDYSDFIDVFKNYPWAKLSESSYAIETSKSPSEIYNELNPHMDEGDQIYIIKLTSPWRGYGPEDVNKWLDDRL